MDKELDPIGRRAFLKGAAAGGAAAVAAGVSLPQAAQAQAALASPRPGARAAGLRISQ